MSIEVISEGQDDNITELLLRWNEGEEESQGSLLEAMYSELNIIASRQLHHEHDLTEMHPNALVHDAYLKLIDLHRINWKDRVHFLAMAATVMREILVDQARKRKAKKRDGGIKLTMSSANGVENQHNTDALMLHKALEELALVDPQKAKLVELRYFGGMTNEETAEALGVSLATVKRHWNIARGWLLINLNQD